VSLIIKCLYDNLTFNSSSESIIPPKQARVALGSALFDNRLFNTSKYFSLDDMDAFLSSFFFL